MKPVRMERHGPDKVLRSNATFVCELPVGAEFLVFRGLLVVIAPDAESYFIRPSDGAKGRVVWDGEQPGGSHIDWSAPHAR